MENESMYDKVRYHGSILFLYFNMLDAINLVFILPASSQLQLAEERSEDGDAKSMNMDKEVFS